MCPEVDVLSNDTPINRQMLTQPDNMPYLRHMLKNQPDLIASPEVARLLRLDARTVQRQAERGELPTVGKLPGRTGAYLFDRQVIEALVLERAA